MTRPLLALAVCLGIGAFLGAPASVQWAWALLGLAASLLALAPAAPPRTASAALAACAVGVGAAAACAQRAEYESAGLRRWLLEADLQGPVRIVGRAAADGRDEGDRWLLLVDTESVRDGTVDRPARGRARIAVGGLAPRPHVIEGDRLTLWTTLRLPRGYVDPATVDRAERALQQGIHAGGYCKSARLVEVRRPPSPGTFSEWVAHIRAAVRQALEASISPGAELAIVRAMVLGDKAGIDEEDIEAFRIAGTYHVLAISGAQVALLGALLIIPLRRAGVPRFLEAVLVAGTLGAYAILVGADVPVVRAALMAGVLLLGRTVDLDSDLANLLGLAAFGLIVVRPSDVGDAGFQLSFAATLGLLVLSRPVSAWLPPLPLRLEWALAASAAAQLALVPLLLAWFHRLAPASLVLNLVAVPLSSAVLISGLVVVAASVFSAWMSSVTGQVAWWLAHALLASGQVVRGVPFLDARLPSPSPAAAAVYLVGLALVAWGRRRRLGLGVTAFGLVAMVFGHPVPSGDGRLHLEVLDVGQGDCLVLRSPRGRTWMVDTGGSFDRAFDPGEAVVGPHLWDAGVTVIDTLLLTHAHPDHVGGVPFILRSFRVGEVWEGPAPRQDPTYSALDTALDQSGVTRRTVSRGVRGQWDDVAYEVLAPAPVGPGSRRTRNDDSVVLSVSLGEVRFLLAGDIESRGEEALHAPPALVLKVPHHGSRTSSTPGFVARVAPRVAILSVGYRSPFGHPHPEVVARYLRAGVRVYRTDRDGTVRVSTDGRSLWVRTATGGSDERIR